jgi:predicted PurR-regulated permease PerM
MILHKQFLFWLGGFLLLCLILFVLRDVLLPFAVGMAIAYFLDPIADRITRLGISRLFATIIILIGFLAVFALAGALLFPILAKQIGTFIDALPGLVQALQNLVPPRITAWVRTTIGTGQNGEGPVSELASQAAGWLATFLTSIWTRGSAIVSSLGLIVLSPVVAFYMLLDWERMITTVDSWVPRRQRATIEQLAREMDRAIAGFVRGQALLCMLLGTFYAIGLSIVGLNFSLLIGLMSGFLSFIPFVGSLTGFVVSVGVALVQFWPDWIMVVAVIGVFLAGQFIEGNILQPRLVGHAVGLHPVWTMFALVAFASLFGFLGALMAIPLAAAVGVLLRFALRRYLESPFYEGVDESETAKEIVSTTVYLAPTPTSISDGSHGQRG